MARLPIVGGDPDNWGTVLNDFLNVAHNSDGTLNAAAVSATAPVTSVAGRVGAVVLARSDVGLGNVDNTSDLNKPISTATSAALNNKLSLSNSLFVIWANSATTFPSRLTSIPADYTGRVVFDSGDFPDHPGPTDMVPGDRWKRRGINPGPGAPNSPVIDAVGSFDFTPAGLSLPQIPIHYAIGSGDPRTSLIVIAMHGNSRDAVGLRNTWAELIADKPIVVVVPEFDTINFSGSRRYNQGLILNASGNLLPASQWTFSYIEPLFYEMRSRIGGQQTTFDMFGHSAGAQFTHRYVEIIRGVPLRRAIAANAGWYTMTDPTLPYPYGSGGAPAALFDWPAAFSADLTILLGDQDTNENDDDLQHDEYTDAQGLNRWDRGNNFYSKSQAYAATLGLPYAWKRQVVPGVAHQTRRMSIPAIDLLLA
ncbi:hypothetical protein FWG95_02195 [Candidatus Saccharibacteria bacterium]|nr:hypothetical protein [Candidatus Saccharibacteria bacterium]